MASSTNQIQARNFQIQKSNDGGYLFLPIEGINSKGINFDFPVTDVTGQSTEPLSNYTESSFNGYGTNTVTASGFVDKRDRPTHIPFKNILLHAFNDPCAKFRVTNEVDIFECDFLITGFEQSAETNGLETYGFSLQNSREVWKIDPFLSKLMKLTFNVLPEKWFDIKYGTDFS